MEGDGCGNLATGGIGENKVIHGEGLGWGKPVLSRVNHGTSEMPAPGLAHPQDTR